MDGWMEVYVSLPYERQILRAEIKASSKDEVENQFG